MVQQVCESGFEIGYDLDIEVFLITIVKVKGAGVQVKVLEFSRVHVFWRFKRQDIPPS